MVRARQLSGPTEIPFAVVPKWKFEQGGEEEGANPAQQDLRASGKSFDAVQHK